MKLLLIVSTFSIILCAGPVKATADQTIKTVSSIGQITNALEVIGGDRLIVTGLMGAGVDPHLYKASESDVRKLSNADMIFYNGLFLEAKMEHVFEKLNNRIPTIPLGEKIAKESLLESVNYSGHFDPHIWFDVTLWMEVVINIRDALCEYDKTSCGVYTQNTNQYLAELRKLDEYVLSRSRELPSEKRILVTAHDAFRYFGRRYGFEVVGLQGVSTESQAGTADVIHLARFIAEHQIRAIFIESSVPERNVKAVQEAVAAQGWQVAIGGELFSDAMGDEGSFEGTYIGMVTHNIDTIVNALKE